MDVFTFEVSRVGIRFLGGAFDGHFFSKGESILVQGKSTVFIGQFPTIDHSSIEEGFWLLFRTVHRGFPAVICRFYNRRTKMLEERYFKAFYKEGIYLCGARYPKRVSNSLRRDRAEDCRDAANKIAA